MIECKKKRCKQCYKGQTDNELRSRITQHRGYYVICDDYVTKLLRLGTGYHFNLLGHVCQNWQWQYLTKWDNDTEKKERNYWVQSLY